MVLVDEKMGKKRMEKRNKNMNPKKKTKQNKNMNNKKEKQDEQKNDDFWLFKKEKEKN